MFCRAADWQGKAEIPLPGPLGQDGKARAHLRLDCPAYLGWWDSTDKPSPFAIWHNGDHEGSPIPSDEWMAYLRFLPTLNADRATK
jgi:hypothetical protein